MELTDDAARFDREEPDWYCIVRAESRHAHEERSTPLAWLGLWCVATCSWRDEIARDIEEGMTPGDGRSRDRRRKDRTSRLWPR